MASVSQSPSAVAGPPVAQPVLTPLTASAVFLVLTIDDGGESVVWDLLSDLSGLARSVSFRYPQSGLAVVAGVGSGQGGGAAATGNAEAKVSSGLASGQ
jgi:porphyrinogen peroxidase